MGTLERLYFPENLAPLRERFEEQIAFEPMSGCWLWLGYVTAEGYGMFSWPHSGRAVPAHRAAMMIYRQLNPAHSVVGHRCGIRACVNPDHLVLGHPHHRPLTVPGDHSAARASAVAPPP